MRYQRSDAVASYHPPCVYPSLTHRAVSIEEGEILAEENGLLFIETSAKDGFRIKDMFSKLGI